MFLKIKRLEEKNQDFSEKIQSNEMNRRKKMSNSLIFNILPYCLRKWKSIWKRTMGISGRVFKQEADMIWMTVCMATLTAKWELICEGAKREMGDQQEATTVVQWETIMWLRREQWRRKENRYGICKRKRTNRIVKIRNTQKAKMSSYTMKTSWTFNSIRQHPQQLTSLNPTF